MHFTRRRSHSFLVSQNPVLDMFLATWLNLMSEMVRRTTNDALSFGDSNSKLDPHANLEKR